MSTAQVLLDPTQYVRINVGAYRTLMQALRDSVRIVFSTSKPSRENTSFHLLSGEDPVMQVDVTDTNIWALATSIYSSLLVTEIKTPMPVATQSAFSAAGQQGRAFARTVPITIAASSSYSVQLQKNSEIAIRFINAQGLYIDAVRGVTTGDVVSLTNLISTNGVIADSFAGLVAVYNGPADGDVLMGAFDELKESFFPDGNFVIEIRNNTSQSVDTLLTIGVQQVSDAGEFTILEPDTALTSTTEMGDFNGTN